MSVSGIIKILFISFFLLSPLVTSGQKKDSVYYVKFVSEENGEELPFTALEIEFVGIRMTASDMNGIAKIKPDELKRSNKKLNFIATNTGFKRVRFSEDTLVLNGTVVIKMKKSVNQLDEIEVISYKVPLIDYEETLSGRQKRKRRRQKKIIEIKDTAICYSEEELKAYEQIVSGKWKVADSLKSRAIFIDSKEWINYWRKNLRYPARAIEWDIQERIYIGWEINEKGQVQNIKLLKGKNPILVLELFRFLEKIPGIKISHDPWQNKPFKPVEFMMPVSFKLR